MSKNFSTQNELLLTNLLEFYKENDNLDKMLNIINGESAISLRIIDWFVTNCAKKYDPNCRVPAGAWAYFKTFFRWGPQNTENMCFC